MSEVPPVPAPAPSLSTGLGAAAAGAHSTPAPAPLALGPVTLQNLPEKLLNLARQITISGTLAEPIDPHNLTLRTALGPLSLQLAAGLPDSLSPNSFFFLQIPAGSPPRQAQLFAAVQPLLANAAHHALAGDAVSGAALGTANATSLVKDSSLRALILPQNLSTLLLASTAQNPFSGFGQSVFTGGGQNPLSTTGQSGPSTASFANTHSGSSLQGAISTQGSLFSSLSNLPNGTSISVRLLDTLSALPAGAVPLNFMVAGELSGGQFLLQGGGLSLLLKPKAALTVGSEIMLLLEGGLPIADTHDTGAMAVKSLRQWESLFAALQQMDPGLAQQLRNLRLPQPGPGLPGAMLFLFMALQHGDLRHWLGDRAFALLNGGARDALRRAAEEFRTYSSAETLLSAVGEWRGLPLPWLDSMGMRSAVLYVHQDPEDAAGNAAPRHAARTRFLVEVEFTRLGSMQVDGLVQPPAKKLDLILRSDTPLLPAVRQQMYAAYENALSLIGYTGHLLFQSQRQGWVLLRPHWTEGAADQTITA